MNLITGFLFLFLHSPHSLFAQSSVICTQAPAECETSVSLLKSIELPAELKPAIAKGQSDVTLPAPSGDCFFLNQKVFLHILDKANRPILWGQAIVTEITGDEFGRKLALEVEPMMTEDILAPACEDCTGIFSRLPAAREQMQVIDLRKERQFPVQIPGSTPIPFNSASAEKFPWVLLPKDKSVPLVLVANSVTTSESFLFPLIKAIKARGHTKIYWYYPGASGLSGYMRPPRMPFFERPVRVKELAELKVSGAHLIITGDKNRIRIPKGLPLPHRTAFLRTVRIPPNKSRNPFVWRSFSGRYDLQLKGLPLTTLLVVADADADDPTKYQLSDILRAQGYTNVQILSGGLLALRESQTQ